MTRVGAAATRPPGADQDGRHFQRERLWRIVALWALVLVAYSGAWRAGLIFDNEIAILNDPRVHRATAENVREILQQDYWYGRSDTGLYRPLTTLTYLLNYAALGNGAEPMGYHALNLALHLANVTLVFLLGMKLFGRIDLAWALAALWSAHPLLTESVTNIVGRADLLMGLGVLAGLLAYIESASASGTRRAMWLIAMVIAQTVGMFSKESAVALPGILLLYDLTLGTPGGWRRRLTAYGLLLAPLAAYFALRGAVHTHLEVPPAANPLVGAGFWTARMTAFKIIGKLAWLFLWPARLSADYSFNSVPLFGWRFGWEDAKAVFSMALCLMSVILALMWRRLRSTVSFFIGFFFASIAPTSNVFVLIGAIMAERFLYLGSIGLAGCAVVAGCALFERIPGRGSVRRRLALCATLAVCFAFAARTYARNLDWQNALSLWTSAVEVSPNAALSHSNLGNALMAKGRLKDAIAEFESALRIRPDYPDAHFNLGIALAQVPLPEAPNRLSMAISEFETALRLRPDYADAHFNLGAALESVPLTESPDRLPRVIGEYEAALRADPGMFKARVNLGLALSQVPGRLPDAIADLRTAIRLQPDSAKAHECLGIVLSRAPGGLSDAVSEFRASLRIDPNVVGAHYQLAYALAQMPDHLSEAIAECQEVLRLSPNNEPGRELMASLLAFRSAQR